MQHLLMPVLMALAISSSAALVGAEKPAPAPSAGTPGASSSTSVTPSVANPGTPGTTPSPVRPNTESSVVPPATVTPEVKPGSSPTGMSVTPDPIRPLTPLPPLSADDQPVKPPVKTPEQRPEAPAPIAPSGSPQGRIGGQTVSQSSPKTDGFKEGRVDRPTIRGVNSIDPFNGRKIGDVSVWTYGLYADPSPSTAIGSGDVVQEPLYLSFSSEENLHAFERADLETRKNLISAARKNRIAAFAQHK